MTEATTVARVPASHPCLPGHFPGRPVVPAVVLLDHVARAVQDQRPGWRLAGVPAAKFQRPVLPEMDFSIELALDDAHLRARFRCRVSDVDGDGDAASGELRFVENASAA